MHIAYFSWIITCEIHMQDSEAYYFDNFTLPNFNFYEEFTLDISSESETENTQNNGEDILN